ncbi:Uncharacterised protein [Phocoenobacter uteri]|uniref:Uncharacterized protein n=1 Tax=Phocoenobacter uteri TaxID=146806 RepID=A0A379CBX2_9PAST|nr:hypothetical protein [Phocoenobacter uteri]MDG6881145.1 hypothetical protein [Phocoenobacter uteri]SUB59167.1 Uncharacterised protein [Phocoenobacter uteri]
MGFNKTTGGACWFCYSHSSYYGEVPAENLIDENGHKIDENGTRVTDPVINPYSEEFREKWINDKNRENPSLPQLVTPEIQSGKE